MYYILFAEPKIIKFKREAGCGHVLVQWQPYQYRKSCATFAILKQTMNRYFHQYNLKLYDFIPPALEHRQNKNWDIWNFDYNPLFNRDVRCIIMDDSGKIKHFTKEYFQLRPSTSHKRGKNRHYFEHHITRHRKYKCVTEDLNEAAEIGCRLKSKSMPDNYFYRVTRHSSNWKANRKKQYHVKYYNSLL